jgi:2-dehydro-3-deoxyphosphogluconate aldolase/(4S)-4-hydroxy-2-oxoglutarate aldolase
MQAKLNPALAQSLKAAGVVPVLTVASAAEGVGLARALVAGGLDLIEVTLRTPASIDVIARIKGEVPEARVGAGTVLTPELGAQSIAAGARFIVAPGMTPRLLEAAEQWPVPFLPGAATASEAMALADLGYQVLKFFPAEPAGGVRFLKALAAPLPGIRFCPTGGIDAGNAAEYLALPNVIAVGGSWVAPAKQVAAQDWTAVTALAAQARAFSRS